MYASSFPRHTCLVHPLAGSKTHRRDASAQTETEKDHGLSFVTLVEAGTMKAIESDTSMVDTNNDTDKLAMLHCVRKTGSISPQVLHEEGRWSDEI